MKKIVQATIAMSLIASVAMANTGVSCKNNSASGRHSTTAFKQEFKAKVAKDTSTKTSKEKTSKGWN
ncbi:hypothetical protein [Bdellovibrio bacteriovorus]|uniref:Lipoprotein n=1 Tax=Bdellovibrio bacteriovorus str. Tiberius TaxID=1069642 RepID=K7YT86_BDEBC|nr:hypothetical protein [Bdellovibrio bacteriovorus]AFX99809.1 hypothetical protein Bdt_0100 [Bdellovibrio bacteriovorus str. Tiberius]